MRLSTLFRYAATTVALTAAAVFVGTRADAADLIGYWDFNTLSIPAAGVPGSSANHPTSIAPAMGTGTLSLTGFTGNIDDFTGTSVNSIPPNTPGQESLTLIPGAGLVGNDDYIEFQFSMTGLSNLGVSYATQSTSTGFNMNQWSYSTNGTTFTNFGPVIAPASAYSLTGPLLTSALDGAATAYLRYTVSGATNAGGNNRLDNVRLESNAVAAPPPNPPSLPQPGDVVFALNNSNATSTLELVRGPATASGGVKHPGPWVDKNFIQSVEFDNYANQSHNARGNVLGVDFNLALGGTGAIYSFATQGSIPAPAPQLIGNTGATGPVGHTGNLTTTRLTSLAVSPDNSKIAVGGADTGRVIVYDYTPGNTMGAGAALANGRESNPVLASGGSTNGTAWLDDDTVIAFSSDGFLYEVDANTMAETFKTSVTTPFINSNWGQLAYNPEISPYLYATYSGFNASAIPNSQTKLWVFNPQNNYALLTPAAGIDLSVSSQTGRELALDEDGNLFIGGFDSTITFIPASMAQNPATITDNSSIFWYQSTSAATSFVGMDIGFGEDVGLPGDLNGDGKVDAADIVVWRATDGTPAGYAIVVQNFGRMQMMGSGGQGNAAVPEPAAALLLIMGLAGLCGYRRAI